MEWSKTYCENLTLGGYSDWRLPNIFELTSLLDNTKWSKPYILDNIENIASGYYWSSSISSQNYAWYVNFVNGLSMWEDKTDNLYLRCVKGKQLIFDDLSLLKKNDKIKTSQKNINRIPKKEESEDILNEEKIISKESNSINSSVNTKIVTKDDIAKPLKQEPVVTESKPKVIVPVEPTIKENIQKEKTISKKESNQNNSSETVRTNDTAADKEVKQGKIMVDSGVVKEYIKAQTVRFNNACVCITEEDLFNIVRNSFRDDNGDYPKGLLNALNCSHQSVRISTKGHSVEITKYPWGAEFAKITDGEATVYAEKSDIIIDSEPVNSESKSEQMKINQSIFSDSATGLVWQDNSEAKTNKKDWNGAKSYCENLTLGGYDWRLPNIFELTTLIDNTKSEKPYVIDGIKNIDSIRYWSSSTFVDNIDYAWRVRFNRGDDDMESKTLRNYVRCVSGKELSFDDLLLLKKSGKIKVSQENIDRIKP